MSYRTSRQPLGKTPVYQRYSIASPPTLSYYDWKVEFVGVKSYYIGHLDCPIADGKFTLGLKGSEKASIDFALLDIPVTSQDNVKIYYKGNLKYQGFINNTVDKRKGSLDIEPRISRFNDTLYNGAFTSTTYKSIIETIIDQKEPITGISFNPAEIQISDTEITSLTFEYEKLGTIFDDMIKQFDGYYYGVTELNELYFKSLSTSISYIWYMDENPPFSDVKIKIDNGKIKMTQAQVYQKSTGGKNVRIGSVGYSTGSTTYPPLTNIINQVGQREGKITVPEGLSTAAGLNYAYQQIIAQTAIPTNIQIKDLNLDIVGDIQVGDYIKIYQPEAIIWNTILDCESLTGWSVGASLSTDAKEGDYSISFTSTNGIYYEYDYPKTHRRVKKIGFWLKSNRMGYIAQMNVANYLNGYSAGNYSDLAFSEQSTVVSQWSTDYTFDVYVKGANVWGFYEFPLATDNIGVISFRNLDTAATIKIDEIMLYQYYRTAYTGNIKEINYTLGSNLVDVTAGYFDEGLNDDFFALEKRVQALETVTST